MKPGLVHVLYVNIDSLILKEFITFLQAIQVI